jgi:hypothetical protein
MTDPDLVGVMANNRRVQSIIARELNAVTLNP